MHPLVLGEIIGMNEPPVTVAAGVWFDPSMDEHVFSTVSACREGLVTLVTFEWPLSGVDPHVHSQTVGPGEAFLTHRAAVRLFTCVQVCVDEELVFPPKAKAALIAFKYFWGLFFGFGLALLRLFTSGLFAPFVASVGFTV